MAEHKKCKRDDCDKVGPTIRGWCGPHYRHWYYMEDGWRETKVYHTEPDGLKRLWSRTTINENGCWVFTGGKSSNDYGTLRFKGEEWLAHRLGWTLLRGEIPEGLTDLDHLCRTVRCWNPDHLEPVTHRENMLRGQWPNGRNRKKSA